MQCIRLNRIIKRLVTYCTAARRISAVPVRLPTVSERRRLPSRPQPLSLHWAGTWHCFGLRVPLSRSAQACNNLPCTQQCTLHWKMYPKLKNVPYSHQCTLYSTMYHTLNNVLCTQQCILHSSILILANCYIFSLKTYIHFEFEALFMILKFNTLRMHVIRFVFKVSSN